MKGGLARGAVTRTESAESVVPSGGDSSTRESSAKREREKEAEKERQRKACHVVGTRRAGDCRIGDEVNPIAYV